jgi:hypothetical protein
MLVMQGQYRSWQGLSTPLRYRPALSMYSTHYIRYTPYMPTLNCGRYFIVGQDRQSRQQQTATAQLPRRMAPITRA